MRGVNAEHKPMSMTEVANLKRGDWAKFYEPLRAVQINHPPVIAAPRTGFNYYRDCWAIYLTYYNGRGGTSPTTFCFDDEEAKEYLSSMNPTMEQVES